MKNSVIFEELTQNSKNSQNFTENSKCSNNTRRTPKNSLKLTETREIFEKCEQFTEKLNKLELIIQSWI